MMVWRNWRAAAVPSRRPASPQAVFHSEGHARRPPHPTDGGAQSRMTRLSSLHKAIAGAREFRHACASAWKKSQLPLHPLIPSLRGLNRLSAGSGALPIRF